MVNSLPMFKLERVSLTVPTQASPLLREISLTVQAGDRWGLIGIAGAGKTSLLRLLNRLSEPTSGAISFQGQDIRKINIYDLRRQVVLVAQEAKLLGMSVEQAIAYPLTLAKLPPEQVKQRLEDWKNRLRLPTDWLQRQDFQLSVGERQWVSLLRGLIMQPPVLLLDEPTTAVDGDRTRLLIEALQTSGQTVIMTSHQHDLIKQFCDRVVCLHRGEIIAQGLTNQFDWQKIPSSRQQPADDGWD
jgi:D-methionine transport system ATP-binding protein